MAGKPRCLLKYVDIHPFLPRTFVIRQHFPGTSRRTADRGRQIKSGELEEARKLRIEGEVLLEVVFASTGKLRVVRVVHGLGHGLDEAAIQAAEQIHFKPALRDGQPADSNAVLHILFQLT